MKSDKTPIVEVGQPNKSTVKLPITKEEVDQKNIDSPAHCHFFNITQHFGIEASLLPEDKQMPITDRCNKRDRLSNIRKQQNIETIMEKSFAFSANKTLDKRPDLDWFNRYISLAEHVSNPTMQDLWAKILAGELARPGLYSLKALKVFRDMSIVDAKLLAKACSMALKDKSKQNIRIISGAYQQPGLFNFFNQHRQHYVNLSHLGLHYADILALADNKLIFQQESESNMMKIGETLAFYFQGTPLKLQSKKNNIALQFYKFTAIGTELANLIADKTNDDFIPSLQQALQHHFEVASLDKHDATNKPT